MSTSTTSQPRNADASTKSASADGRSSRCNSNRIINTLNIFGYLFNLATAYLGGVAGWFGGVSNQELSDKYQTLITPAAIYFGYIWGLIFLFQGFFAAAQILPRFRDHPLVQRGIGYWYFMTCLAQSAWTICFGYEMFITAFVAMAALLLTLLTILNLQWRSIDQEERKKKSDRFLVANNAISLDDDDFTASFPSLAYWLLRFPFAIHAGWIAIATPLMLSVLLVSKIIDTQIELWVAVISVAMLFGMCMGLLLRQDSGAPSYVFPAVVAYGCAG
eukprot:scaffold3010_cov198-Alexandrium_tamarense.AAC.3